MAGVASTSANTECPAFRIVEVAIGTGRSSRATMVTLIEIALIEPAGIPMADLAKTSALGIDKA